MHFEIRAAGRHLCTWGLLDASHMSVNESDWTFPSEAQALAAALAFSKLMTRAWKALSAQKSDGLLCGRGSAKAPLSLIHGCAPFLGGDQDVEVSNSP
jgi:hypothetical protein